MRRMELTPIINAAVDSIQPAAQDKNISLEIRDSCGPVEIECDPDRYRTSA